MQLIVIELVLEACGPSVFEVLSTVHGVVSVCGVASFSRTDY